MIIFGLISELIYSKILSKLSIAKDIVSLKRFSDISTFIEIYTLLSLYINLLALYIRLYSIYTKGVDLLIYFRGSYLSSFIIFFNLVEGFIRLSGSYVSYRVIIISIYRFSNRYIDFINAVIDTYINNYTYFIDV